MLQRILLSTVTFLIFINLPTAQDISFNLSVSADTILQGNILKVKFEVQNTQGQFEPPSFENWLILGGPNTSSQFSMINGQVSQSASYEYILQAPEEGAFLIDSGKLNNGEQALTTEPLMITVLPNPDGKQVMPQRYGYQQKIISKPAIKDSLSPQDSMRIKLGRLKSTKI